MAEETDYYALLAVSRSARPEEIAAAYRRLARAYGLHACAQEAWTSWHKTVSAFLKLPPEHILFCGIALGHADENAPINQWLIVRKLAR